MKKLLVAFLWMAFLPAAQAQINLGKIIKEKTGLIIDPYFSASGLHWIFNNVSGIKEKAEKGEKQEKQDTH